MDVQLPQITPAPGSSDVRELFWQQLVKQNRRSRRSFPRIHADIPVQVLEIENQPIKVHSRDISFGGLQIRCNPETSQRLLRLKPEAMIKQNKAGVNPVDGIVRMKLQLNLVVDTKVHQIHCLARVAHYVHVPDSQPGQEIAMGFQFLSFRDQGQQLLSKFVEEHLIPAGF